LGELPGHGAPKLRVDERGAVVLEVFGHAVVRAADAVRLPVLAVGVDVEAEHVQRVGLALVGDQEISGGNERERQIIYIKTHIYIKK
jgi:hypothetical protein